MSMSQSTSFAYHLRSGLQLGTWWAEGDDHCGTVRWFFKGFHSENSPGIWTSPTWSFYFRANMSSQRLTSKWDQRGSLCPMMKQNSWWSGVPTWRLASVALAELARNVGGHPLLTWRQNRMTSLWFRLALGWLNSKRNRALKVCLFHRGRHISNNNDHVSLTVESIQEHVALKDSIFLGGWGCVSPYWFSLMI